MRLPARTGEPALRDEEWRTAEGDQNPCPYRKEEGSMRRRWILPGRTARVILVAAATAPFLMAAIARAQVDGTPESDTPPRVVQRVVPEHPEWANEGVVYLKVVVNELGRVTSVTDLPVDVELPTANGQFFEKPCFCPELRTAAVDAMKEWIFEPATLNGKPVESTAVIPFEFSGFTGSRPGLARVCGLALAVEEMEEHWRIDEFPDRAPLTILISRHLQQFGTPPVLRMRNLEMFGQPVVLVDDVEEAGGRPYVEVTWLAIEESTARVEYEYAVEAVRCYVRLSHTDGRWEVEKAEVWEVE